MSTSSVTLDSLLPSRALFHLRHITLSIYPLVTGLQPSSPTEALLSFSYNPIWSTQSSWAKRLSRGFGFLPLRILKPPYSFIESHAQAPSSILDSHPHTSQAHLYVVANPVLSYHTTTTPISLSKSTRCLLHLPRK